MCNLLTEELLNEAEEITKKMEEACEKDIPCEKFYDQIKEVHSPEIFVRAKTTIPNTVVNQVRGILMKKHGHNMTTKERDYTIRLCYLNSSYQPPPA